MCRQVFIGSRDPVNQTDPCRLRQTKSSNAGGPKHPNSDPHRETQSTPHTYVRPSSDLNPHTHVRIPGQCGHWSTGPCLDRKNTTAHEMCQIQGFSLPNLEIVLTGLLVGKAACVWTVQRQNALRVNLITPPPCHFARTLCFGTAGNLSNLIMSLCNGIAGRC